MTKKQLIEGIKIIDTRLKTGDLSAMELKLQLRNREWLVNQVFAKGNLTKLLQMDLLLPPQ